LLVACFLCLLGVMVVRYVLPPYIIHYVRDRSVQIVKERFHADVQFGRFDITLDFPRLVIDGDNMALTRRGRAGLPALIFVKRFRVDANVLQFARTPAHVHTVQLEGMAIHIPPRGPKLPPAPYIAARQHYPVIVDHLECDGCELNILPRRLDKQPLHFAIHRLSMQSVGLGRSAPYQASLTNAVPRGEIRTMGHFGPWQPDDPSLTALSGTYQFSHADLDPLPGIAGTLDSTGKFEGILERIVADGQTSTPDFALDVTDHPIPLKTQFHAIIDGTTGDTALDPVHAQFLNTALVATGGVFGLPGRRGKAVLLDVVVQPGRLEDILRLGTKSARPAMTGSLRFHTQLALPPGQEKVSERLKLDGRFFASQAEPTSPEFREKLRKLSRRAQGKPKDQTTGSDTFDLRGRFILDSGRARFPALQFSIPGAVLDLEGQYGLYSQALDFQGKLQLRAKLSQTTTGVKSFFLKVVDPFFSGKNGGAVLPIRITGTREHPKFGLGHRPAREKKKVPESRAERTSALR
jgi:hypothetical protein